MRVFGVMRLVMVLGVCSVVFSCAPVVPGAPPIAAQGVPVGTPVPALPLPESPWPTAPVPAVSSVSAVVLDGVTGRILAAKNPHEKRAVASTQKMLTALTVLESGPLSDPVTVESGDTIVEPSKIYIRSGETYTRGALVKALVVKSGNDVAKALARDVAGSEEQFMVRMNQKAQRLGMRNSFFVNPHGLTEEGQYSTGMDVAVLGRAAYQSAVLRSFMKVKRYEFVRPSGKTKELVNTNRLLERVEYCTGMKTGTTRASGKCLISAGELNNRVAIVVVLGAPSEAVLYRESEALLRWALER
ncbi:MAG: D-alanyl-D-alanine carboxypeptidase family protein [Verrucomicrobiota bacterium]